MRAFFVIIFAYIFTSGCKQGATTKSGKQYTKDSLAAIQYIVKGNGIYEAKSGVDVFAESIKYYDSAFSIAEKSNDNLLLGASYFAKGRAYDAWNKQPYKTIEYYGKAAVYYSKIPGRQERTLYLKHLVAHGYDKMNDSINCINIVRELYTTIQTLPDSVRKNYGFIAELALVSSTVGNYLLADSILQHLTKREWIVNHAASYNYLDHYYLSKSRIDIFGYKNEQSKYLDSLSTVFNSAKNLSDSLFYCDQLRQLYNNTSLKTKALFYEDIYKNLLTKISNPDKVNKAIGTFQKIEKTEIEKDKKLTEQKLTWGKWGLIGLLIVAIIITALLAIVANRNKQLKKIRNELIHSNQYLTEKKTEVDMLNKEIHHRVKNNLQMVMNLINHQQRKIAANGGDITVELNNIKLRIQSIAELHEQLIEESETQDLTVFFKKLVSKIITLQPEAKPIITHLHIEPCVVPQKTSFALGLIVNEWITNSLRYAEPNDETLEINLKLICNKNDINITYYDNGIPVSAQAQKTSTGQSLIDLLLIQLKAKRILLDDNAYYYDISINTQ